MKVNALFLACVALIGFCSAAPQHFQRGNRAMADERHKVMFGLRQNNFGDSCPSLLEKVSDPKSRNYGQYLRLEQLHKLTYDAEAIHEVTSYLKELGVRDSEIEVSRNGEFVKVISTVGRMESIFNTEFHDYTSISRNQKLRRATSFNLPSSLKPYVDIVTGLNDFPIYNRKVAIKGLSSNKQSGSVTPQLIWKTYGLPNETDPTPKADQSVFEALGQSYSPQDLTQFQQQYNLPQQGVSQIIGPNDPSACTQDPNNCAEANLDVQYIMAMAQGAPTIYWSIPQNDTNIFLDWIDAVAQDSTPPQVFSVSYGGLENEEDPSIMTKFNAEVCKMGLRGITVFVASGDDGVAGYIARSDQSECGINPDYPAGCPYVTAVGATMGPESGKPEVACMSNAGSIITTGGGFSNTFATPSWQQKAVSNYLQNAPNLPPTSMFNTKGRGYPDVAALGNNYNVVIGGQTYIVSGTSASSPIFCAMVTLANGYREVKGKSPLGFLNPLLYSMDGGVFNDITKGENNCCAGQSPVCCQYGFNATAGWDPLTGLGSINFPKFLDAVLQLP